jgi:hypothetical protein
MNTKSCFTAGGGKLGCYGNRRRVVRGGHDFTGHRNNLSPSKKPVAFETLTTYDNTLVSAVNA